MFRSFHQIKIGHTIGNKTTYILRQTTEMTKMVIAATAATTPAITSVLYPAASPRSVHSNHSQTDNFFISISPVGGIGVVGELLALRVRVMEVPLGVNLVLEEMVLGLEIVVIAAVAVFVGVKLMLEGMVLGLDMAVIVEVTVFVGVKLVESVFLGVKLVESGFIGVKLVLEVMVVRLDMVVIAAVAVFVGVKLVESVFVGVKLIESGFVGVKLIESGFVGVKLLLEAMVVRLDMVVIAEVELFV